MKANSEGSAAGARRAGASWDGSSEGRTARTNGKAARAGGQAEEEPREQAVPALRQDEATDGRVLARLEDQF